MQIKALKQILVRDANKPRAASASKPSFCVSEVSGDILESQPDKFFDIVATKSGPAYAVCNSVPAAKLNAFLAAGKSALMRDAASGAFAANLADSASLRASIAAKLISYGVSENVEPLSYLLAHEFTGYGPIGLLLDSKDEIEEITVDSPSSHIGLYHSRFGYCQTNMRFSSEFYMRFVFNRLIERSELAASGFKPIIDTQTTDGFRVHLQLPPYAPGRAVASIRLRERRHYNPARLVSDRSVSPEALAYLWVCIESGLNIVISGPPASGKTSLLSALLFFVGRGERILAIEEDSSELLLERDMPNLVLLKSVSGGVGPSAQITNALHMRPERLVVGEIRGAEASRLYSGANLGIPFMTTMHSNPDPSSLLARLSSRPMSVEEHSISMTDIAVFMRKDGAERTVSGVAEYSWLSRGEISGMPRSAMKVNSIVQDGKFDFSSLSGSKVARRYSKMHGSKPTAFVDQIRRRAKYLSESRPDFTADEMLEWIRSYEE